jgi:imidazoleglycerol-phosphate dehydratase
VSTGIRFLDHMLELFTRHGGFDLKLQQRATWTWTSTTPWKTSESLWVRYSTALWETAAVFCGPVILSCPWTKLSGLAAVDFGGRAAAVVDTKVRAARVGDLQVELVPDFFEGFARGARANVHARVLYGRSSHHKIEALFKAFARALRVACSRDRRLGRMLPSTKGLL